MARRRRLKITPVVSAFIWGVLTGLGIDPTQMIFETTLKQLGPYVQIASVLLFLVVLYFSYNWIIEGVQRSRKAFRVAGTVGIAAIVLAFISVLLIFTWDRAAVVLVVAVVAWIYATWR
jgi:hypothetical protein